ncbi:MAG: DNA polymerase III PolC-type [Candidatus Anoxychlamydiales bacterium]|nr:DNA polymerase III PolC-type [Candidatus Anoxychlamydiales bacterium]
MTLRPIFYDLETTGIDNKKDRIIEIAAYDPTLNKTYCKLVNPNMPIPHESTQITNITDDMVKDAKAFDEISKEFVEFCSGDVVLIAHNNDNFDKLFLKNEFARVNVTFPDFLYVDSLKWARKYRSDLPRHALQYLREIYKIEQNNAHRALDDVMVLYKVFMNMVDDLNIETIHKLLYQTTNELLTHMPFGKYSGKPLKEVPSNYIQWLNKNEVLEKDEHQTLKKSLKQLNLI